MARKQPLAFMHTTDGRLLECTFYRTKDGYSVDWDEDRYLFQNIARENRADFAQVGNSYVVGDDRDNKGYWNIDSEVDLGGGTYRPVPLAKCEEITDETKRKRFEDLYRQGLARMQVLWRRVEKKLGEGLSQQPEYCGSDPAPMFFSHIFGVGGLQYKAQLNDFQVSWSWQMGGVGSPGYVALVDQNGSYYTFPPSWTVSAKEFIVSEERKLAERNAALKDQNRK